ncbi:reverse transcriptase [Tanacetum coccineum]
MRLRFLIGLISRWPIQYLTFSRGPGISYVSAGLSLYARPRGAHFSDSQADLTVIVEAEYRGVAYAVAENAWLRNYYVNFILPLATATLAIVTMFECKLLLSIPVQHQRTKHIEIDIHFVRDLVATGAIRVLHVPSRYQYADIFTKGLPTSLFDEFRTSLSVRSSPAPTARGSFVSDRVITDNAIVAFEVLHWLKNKKRGKKGSLALKVDMSKAYDRVEWPFIHCVLKKFGLPSHFINLIMACVSSITFSFNINGQVSGHVIPTRGLRQGDPISPYLFIMCAEVLSSMIRKSVTQGHNHGVKVCRGAPIISHLFFADDSIFFSRASEFEGCKLKSILDQYCKASGQVINYEKSEISFSANVDQHVRSRVIQSLSVREVAHQTKYLGLPSIIGKSKKLVIQTILDKIKKKLGGWKEKTLSVAGKEVLIKSVAQAMPMYVMNIFLLPETLIDDIHKALNFFWWGDGVKENPIRWCTWERMCVSKFRGGMGFRHLGLFNRALIANQVWRLITSPSTLSARLLKARYFPRSSFFDANIGYRPSYIWRSFVAVKDLVHRGCKWNLGDGRTVNVWEDFWLADHKKLGPKPHNTEVYYVRDLLNNEGNDWDYEKLTSLFPPYIANKIACCFVSDLRPDTLYWHNSSRGQFSCKSAYFLALKTSQELVQISSDEAVKFFHAVWMAKCPKAKDVWDRCSFGKLYDTPHASTIGDFCRVILDTSPMCWDIFTIILWGLWIRLNKHFHRQIDRREADMEVMAKQMLLDYSDANKKDVSRGFGSTQITHVGVWKKPQAGKIKFNCDVAWQKQSGKVGLGFVARNSDEEVLISGAKSECYANSPLEAEAKAIWWATIHARTRGYANVVFETDSLSLVNALRNQSIPLQIATLFWALLSNSRVFNSCEWSFVRREGNQVAHSIASWALGCTNNVILDGEVSNCATALAVKDAISSEC